MPAQSYVYFALKGEEFDPAEVSRRLTVEPTAVWRQGDKLRYKSRVEFAGWEWRTRTAALRINELVTEVLTRFEGQTQAILDLKQQFGLESVLHIVLYVDVNDEEPTPALGHGLRTIAFLCRTQTRTDVGICRYDSRNEKQRPCGRPDCGWLYLRNPSGPMKKFAVKRDAAALDKLIAAAQLQPLMSNAKWVKLIGALVYSWPLVQRCRVKLIWEDASVERHLHLDEHDSYNFHYYASAMESMISGRPNLGGWCAYKEIEWLEFPRLVGGETQDLAAIQRVIEAVGQFRLVLTEDSLRLIAYLRP